MVVKSKANQYRYSENLRRQTSRVSRKKKREYLEGMINELVTNNKNRVIRDL